MEKKSDHTWKGGSIVGTKRNNACNGEGEVGKSLATSLFHLQHDLKILHSTAVLSNQGVSDNYTIHFP